MDPYDKRKLVSLLTDHLQVCGKEGKYGECNKIIEILKLIEDLEGPSYD